MKQPMILVTAGYQIAKNGTRQRYLYQNYADGIRGAGGFPLLPLDGGDFAAESARMCDGLLLTGGPDIEPVRYHQETDPLCGPLDLERDAEEWALLDAFVKAGKPVFGICRGLQVINTFFGGTLYQDLPSRLGVQHSGGVVHSLAIEEGSFLFPLYGRESVSNSYHHQSVDRVAEGFAVAARSGEIVEAIEHRSMPVAAVQYHPERMTGRERFAEHGPDTAPLFAWFVRQCMGEKRDEGKIAQSL